MARRKRKAKGSGGRRANYAPSASEMGIRGKLPVGWVNISGFVLFSVVSLALIADLVRAAGGGRGNDPLAILIVLALSLTVVWLFATTRVED